MSGIIDKFLTVCPTSNKVSSVDKQKETVNILYYDKFNTGLV